MRTLAETFLVNKTIFFVGDSINGLVYHAAVRAAPNEPHEPNEPCPAAWNEPLWPTLRV